MLYNSKKFQWIGEGVPLSKRKFRQKIRFKAFTIDNLKIEVGDFVLVRNDDALDPEDFMNCYVAEVKDLFDTGDEFDPYQARVQWFSRVLELPTYAIKLLKNVGHELEIVKDKRSSWHNIIDAETIFKKCEVLFLSSDCDFESAISEYKDHTEFSTPVFFCRYTFTGTSLIDLKDEIKKKSIKVSLINENSSVNGTSFTKSRLLNKSYDQYCAISIGSPSKIPRVVIKKIDDKILENSKNVRIFVADSNVKNVEDVADIFLNKLKLKKKEEDSLEKRPIIHTFSSQNDNSERDYPCVESSSESSSTSELINNRKYSLNFNTKFCKNIFTYNTRNSPKKNISTEGKNLCTIPTKKPRFTMINNLKLKHSRSRMNGNIAESRSGKQNHKNQEKQRDFDVNKKKIKRESKLEVHDISLDSDLEIDPLSLSFSTKRNSIAKETASPANKSTKKLTASEKKLSKKCTKLENFDLCSTPKKEVLDSNSKGSSPSKYLKMENSESYFTPKKKSKFTDGFEDIRFTRSGRRVKAINYAEVKNETTLISAVTPTKKLSRCSDYSDDSDSANFTSLSYSSSSDEDDINLLNETSPDKTKKSSKRKTSKKSESCLNVQTPKSRKNLINLHIPERKMPLKTPKNALEESRQRLHVSSVPNSLPCRDEEYSDIYSFVKGCLCAQTGGCMYISGVPGTGKTATVHEVMHNLEEEKELGEIPIFTFIEVNGMWMTDPYQCYVQIFKALTGKSIAPQQAADLLEKRFTERGPKKDAVVLLVDELDRLWTRKQTVMYNIFDWPTKINSKLIVLAIANTMDLPERMMMNRISSRLGLTRRTFQPYTFKQLQEIIMSRIQELKIFDPDAVQLVARKVAAVSGDARRALDICRFATETVKVGQNTKKGQKILIGMEHVDKALQQMFSSPVISAIRSSSKIVKLFFHCILSEFTRSGLEETTLLKVHSQLISTCRFEGLKPPNSTEISRICADLAVSHLILVDNFKNDVYMKIRLNVSSDDVSYALTLK